MIYFSRPTEMYRKVLRDRRRYSEKNRLMPSYIRSRFIQIEFRQYIIHCVQSNQYIIKSTSSNMTKEGKKKQSCLCIIGCVFGKNRSDCQGNGGILAGTKLCTRGACAKVSRRGLEYSVPIYEFTDGFDVPEQSE